MPVAFVFESDSLDQARYDEFVKMTGYDNLGAALPPGGIAHLAGPRPEGGGVSSIYGNRKRRPMPITAPISSGP
jgi:hypothetical protein